MSECERCGDYALWPVRLTRKPSEVILIPDSEAIVLPNGFPGETVLCRSCIQEFIGQFLEVKNE